MKSKTGMTLAAMAMCGLLGASAVAQQDTSMGKQDMDKSGNKSMMMLNSTDKKFMTMAAMGGMAEVEEARLALQKSSNEGIKEYAQHMIDEHTKANEELMQVVQMKGVTLTTTPAAKHVAMMAKMQALSGAEFDMMYVKNSGVKDHEKMAKLFQDEIARGKDADAKAFASKTLPVVQMHLQMARDMSAKMMGMKSGMKMDKNKNTNTSM